MQNGCFTFIVVLFLLAGAVVVLGQDGADAGALEAVGSRLDRVRLKDVAPGRGSADVA